MVTFARVRPLRSRTTFPTTGAELRLQRERSISVADWLFIGVALFFASSNATMYPTWWTSYTLGVGEKLPLRKERENRS